MKMRLLAAVVLAAMVSLPALPAGAEGSEENREFREQLLAEALAAQAAASTLTEAEAVRLLTSLAEGHEVAAEQAADLARFLRDAQDSATFGRVLVGAVENLDGASADHWQDGLLGQRLGPALDAANAAGCAQLSEFCPHNYRFLGGQYLGGYVGGYCAGDSWNGYCVSSYAFDVFGLTSVDRHLSRDLAFVHSPFSYDIVSYYSCYYDPWWGWWCSSWSSYYNTVRQIASNVQYELALPLQSGALATRATDGDSDFRAMEQQARLAYAKPREATSASPLVGTQVDGTLGTTPAEGTPGLGDVVAASPVPTAFGLQKPSRVPDRPGVPPTPADGAINGNPTTAALYAQAKAAPGSVSIRNRDFATTLPASVDSTGLTLQYKASSVLTGQSNVLFVRTKVVGTGAVAGLPAAVSPAPASFYYDAGSHIFGSGNRATMDFGMGHPVVALFP